MKRSVWEPLLGVTLAAALLATIGCYSRKENTPAAPKAQAPAPPKPAGNTLLADWPTPAGALLITGQQHGYLEPCGCTEGQIGGLGRRYDLLGRLKARGWPVALVELGGMADPPPPRGGPVESRIKYTIALRALALMKYNALALSAEDMKLGVLETLGQLLNFREQNAQPVVVAANVVPAEGFEKLVQPAVRTAAGPIKIGITAALDPASFQELSDPDKTLLQVNDPLPSLQKTLAELEKDTDVQVLMVQGPPEKAPELAKALPGFDLVVGTSEIVDPDAEAKPLNDGKTLLIQVGMKGKAVGVVGLYQDAKQRFRFRNVTLNTVFARSPEPMKKLVEDDFQEELKQLKVAEDYPKHDYVGGAEGASYIGALACKSCHPNTYAKWASTKHSQGYESLKAKGRDRRFDAECLTCHTTGYEYTSGYRSAELTAYLEGNQCENCHGPGSKHAAEPDNAESRKLMAQPVANPDENRLCYRCHDEDNSPKFNFQVYYGQIIHKELDRYDDPKVHQGITPEVAARAAKTQGN